MALELCQMSLQQTRELLRLTDLTLQGICCGNYTSQELYVVALRQVLGGGGKRGPQSIFLVFDDNHENVSRGRVFQLKLGRLFEMSEEIVITAGSKFALHSLGNEAVVSNWCDSCESVEEYQDYFHPDVKSRINVSIKNFVVCRISGERAGAIIAFNYPGEATDYDAEVLQGLAVVIGSIVTISNQFKETEHAFIYTIEALARACEAAEEDTGRHIIRVNRYSSALAANMGLDNVFTEAISYSAQMHDVGKIKVPTAILLKSGSLDPDELQIMRMHPVYGQQILGDSPRLQLARDVAISHHENWDGSGYPYNLKGEQIPLAGRIVKLADVYDALRSRRSYKEPVSHTETLQIFRMGDERIKPAVHFDPEILDTFFKIEHIFNAIFEELAVIDYPG